MKRGLLPSPSLSLVLFALWLLLNGSLALAQILLAALLALGVPLLTERLRDKRARMQSPLTAIRLALIVIWDILVSNLQVARLILGPESRIHPDFVWIPLELRNLHGIAALAGIITMTPGTLSCDLTADKRALLVHCLDVQDKEAVIAQIKARYEQPLLRIFPS